MLLREKSNNYFGSGFKQSSRVTIMSLKLAVPCLTWAFSCAAVHIEPLHKDLPDKDVLPGLLRIDDFDSHLRNHCCSYRLSALPSIFAILRSGHSRHMWLRNRCLLELGRLESTHRFDNCHLAHAEVVAPPNDVDAGDLDYDYIWDLALHKSLVSAYVSLSILHLAPVFFV